MSKRTVTLVVVVIVGLSLLLRIGGVLFAYVNRAVVLPGSWSGWEGQLVSIIGTASMPIVGGLIAARQPRNLYGWMWLLNSLCLGLLSFAAGYSTSALLVAPPAPPLGAAALVLAGWSWLAWLATLPFLLLLFPTGRLPSRRWHPVPWLVLAAALAAASIGWAMPDQSGLGPTENPLAIEGFVGELARVVVEGSVLVMFGVMLASIVSLGIRFRRAQGVERQQFKWLVYAAAVVAIYLIASFFVTLPGLLDVVFQTIPLAVLPVAVGIAILRHRLYDIDVLINRTLVYSSLTAVLAIVYVGSVLLLQRLLAPLTRGSDVELVLSTLAIVVLFSPVRQRIQNTIDRRFYRHKYDAAALLASFSSRVQRETRLDELTTDVLSVVDQAVHPAHVSMGLREAGRGAGRARPSPTHQTVAEPAALRQPGRNIGE